MLVLQCGYCIGVFKVGCYVEIFNSDLVYYGGSNLGNVGVIEVFEGEWMNLLVNFEIILLLLGVVVLVLG